MSAQAAAHAFKFQKAATEAKAAQVRTRHVFANMHSSNACACNIEPRQLSQAKSKNIVGAARRQTQSNIRALMCALAEEVQRMLAGHKAAGGGGGDAPARRAGRDPAQCGQHYAHGRRCVLGPRQPCRCAVEAGAGRGGDRRTGCRGCHRCTDRSYQSYANPRLPLPCSHPTAGVNFGLQLQPDYL